MNFNISKLVYYSELVLPEIRLNRFLSAGIFKLLLERLSLTYTTNGKCQIQLENFSK